MAPSDMRFPLTPRAFMPITAPSIASGIVDATMSPARRLRSSRNSTTTTSSPPSRRLCSTVRSVRSTIVVRS